MGAVQKGRQSGSVDKAIVQLLGHRYGDGLVYLRDDGERSVLARAVSMGLVSSEGYLTPAGLSVLARNGAD